MAHGAYLHLTGSKSTYWSAYWMCHGGSWCVCKQGTYPYSNGQNLGYTPFSDPLKYQFVRVKYPTISTQYVWIYIHILFYILLYMCKPFTAPTYSHYRPIIYIYTHTLYHIYIKQDTNKTTGATLLPRDFRDDDSEKRERNRSVRRPRVVFFV